MRPPLLLPLLSAALLGPVRAGRADETDEARALLTRAVKAHGGKETLAKYKCGQSKNKGKIQLPGVGEVEFTQEVAYMQPDRFRETVEMTIAGQRIKVVGPGQAGAGSPGAPGWPSSARRSPRPSRRSG